MADRSFDIEVLIKARNAASKVLNDFAKDVKNSDGNVKDLGKSTKDTNKAMKDLGERLGPVNERVKTFSSETRVLGNRLKNLNDHVKDLNKSTSTYRTVVQNSVEAQKRFSSTTKKLEKDLEELGKAVRFAMGDTSDYVKVTAEMVKAQNNAAKSSENLAKSTRKVREEYNSNDNTFARFADRLLGIEHGGRRADASLRDLALSARGFVYAFAIKYAQALTSALVGLGGEAIAVAASMTSAGAAIGGAFTSGVLQAIPAVGLLIASLTRVSQILEALNLKKTIAEGGNRRDRQGEQESLRDLDRITNAQESLADAQRDLARAQEDLTDARRDARRELEDLIRAERDARLAARGAALSQEDAQRNLRAALAGGDVAAIRSAELDVDQASEGVVESRLRASRSAADAARGRRGGIEGTDRVINARRQLADAERRVARETRDAARAQRESAISTAENSAQTDRLTFLLEQLSPAERNLLKAVERLQATYKKAFRPITDIIVRSFTDSVNQVNILLQDQSILASFRGLAKSIARSIREITNFGGGAESRSFIEFFVGEATRNIPKLTDSFIGIARSILRIGEAATPIFDRLVELVDEISTGLLKVTGDQNGLDEFFDDAEKDLEGIIELVKSLGRVFVAIFDPARDAGREAIERMTGRLNNLAKFLRDNERGVRKFFEDSTRVTVAIFGVIRALIIEVAKIFNPESVEEFARVLENIFIPALGQAIRLMGLVTHAVQSFLNIPLVSDIARFTFTIFLFTKALDILRRSLASIALVFAGLFGTASRGAGAFSSIARVAILVGGALATLGVEVKGVGDILGTTVGKVATYIIGSAGFIALMNKAANSSKAFRSTVALQTAGTLTGISRFTRGAAARMNGLRALFATNPFGLLITGIGLALTAFGLFRGATEDTENATESLTDALLAQKDAYRALRDGALDTKDALLAVQSAEIRLDRAQIARRQLIREIDKDGKRTVEERRQLKEANIDVAQSEIDLTRARRRAKDAREDERTNLKKFQEESKKTLEQGRENVKALKEEKKESDGKIRKLKEIVEAEAILFRQGIGSRERLTGFEERLRKEQEKNRDITKKLKSANIELNDALRTAGRGFFKLGRNADAFGLTFSDVLKFLERGANKALGAFGAKKVDIALDYIKNSSYIISEFPEKRAQGGIIDGSGLMDTVPIMAAPGEGILNRHQMPIVDMALRASGIMGGGLSELWSRVQTPHFMARGGFVQGAVSSGLTPAAINLAQRLFKLGYSVTSAYRAGDPRQHGRGEALDFGDSVNDLGQLWRLLFPIRGQFNQLLGPPGLYNGLRRFSNPTLQASHNDHIHIGLRGAINNMLGVLNETLGRVSIKGGPDGYMTRIIRAAEKRIRGAGQGFIDRESSKFGDDPSNIEYKRTSKGALSINQVRGIAGQALRLLGIKEQKADWQKMLIARAYQESGFNPNAVNRWDSNAARGTPSQGLMQTIASTFRAYALPGFNNILNPLHNMLAAIRYMIARYGKGDSNDALRAMFGRNAAKVGYNTGGGIGRFASARVDGSSSRAKSMAQKIADAFDNNIFKPIVKDIEDAIKKIKKGKFIRGLSDLTAENGALPRFLEALGAVGERIADRIARGNIKVGNKGKITVLREGIEQSEAELRGLRGTQATLLAGRGELGDAENAAEKAVNKAEKDLAIARNTNNKAKIDAAKKRLKQVKAGLRGVKQARTELENLITSNAQEILDKQKEIETARKEEEEARKQAELEATQALIDAADRRAGFSTNRADRTSRIGTIVGARTAGGFLSAFGFQRQSLDQRSAALIQQRNELDAARNRALSLGQTELAEDLADRLEDLNVTIEENNLAIQQNTDAQRDANVSSILSRNSFLTGVNSSAIGFFQGLQSLTGSTQSGPIANLLRFSNSTLRGTNNNLLGEFNLILSSLGLGGISGSGSQLVNSLVGLSSVDTSGLTPEGKARFEQLISALIENESAINANTEQLNSLTQSVSQSFESTSWKMFRQAIFDGAGGLIPRYQNLVPQMYEGGIVQSNGLFYLHAGEKVTPKNYVSSSGKEEHNWYITSPTEVADPDHFASVFSFRRSTQRAN